MELKAIRGGDIHDAVEFRRPANGEYPEDTEYYLKSEVDRYIAELQSANQLEIDEWYNKLMRQKYKRCLDKAKICQLRLERYEQYVTKYKDCNYPSIQRWRFLKDHYEKWYNRWWKIADQFKPDSTDTKENNNG